MNSMKIMITIWNICMEHRKNIYIRGITHTGIHTGHMHTEHSHGEHGHAQQGHDHVHRRLKDILEIIDHRNDRKGARKKS